MPREIFFFENHAGKKIKRLVPDLYFFKRKASLKVKASGQYLSFNISW